MRAAQVGLQFECLLKLARRLRQLPFAGEKLSAQLVGFRQIRIGAQCGFDGFLGFPGPIQLEQRQRVVVARDGFVGLPLASQRTPQAEVDAARLGG